MKQFFSIALFLLLTTTVQADPIPKQKPTPTYGIVLRDGMITKYRIEKKSSAGGKIISQDFQFECKITKRNEKGIYFDRILSDVEQAPAPKNGKAAQGFAERYYVDKMGHVFIDDSTPHELPLLGDKVKLPIKTMVYRGPKVIDEKVLAIEPSELEFEGKKYSTLKCTQSYEHNNVEYKYDNWFSDQTGPGLMKQLFKQHFNGVDYETTTTLLEYTPGK